MTVLVTTEISAARLAAHKPYVVYLLLAHLETGIGLYLGRPGPLLLCVNFLPHVYKWK